MYRYASFFGHIVLVLVFFSSLDCLADPSKNEIHKLELTKTEAEEIGRKVFLNECGGNADCLVYWNEGESFPSLGIGHFIWYPTGVNEPYFESFPLLVDFIKANNIPLPPSIVSLRPFDAPWSTRNEFQSGRKASLAMELKEFLKQNIDIQIKFMLRRCIKALHDIVDSVALSERKVLILKINKLLETPDGIYPLIDYVNFKGEGLVESERYKGQGWGLKQVLQNMRVKETKAQAKQEFARASKQVLWQRVNRASDPIEKTRWYPAWEKRINTYVR